MWRKLFLNNSIKPNVFSARFRNCSSTNIAEISLPVPWGELRGKWWGPKDRKPILALHGWQDNCGTFDRLFPMLPQNLSILSIDFPGHGYSSRYPIGMTYHSMNYVILVRMLQKMFAWEDIMLLGHSMGAMTSFTFSITYPESAKFLVCFDFFKPLQLDYALKTRPIMIDQFIKFNDHLSSDRDPPKYTMDQLTEMWHLGLNKTVARESCKYILERNTIPVPNEENKYYLTRDPRLKIENLLNFEQNELREGAARLSSPIFISRGTYEPRFEDDKYYFDVLDIVKKTSKDCRFYQVEGTHHHHLNNPEVIADKLTDFLNQYYVVDSNVEQLVKTIKFV